METETNRDTWSEREFTVAVTVPDPAWRVAIEEIHVVGEELWVLSRLERNPETLAPQVIGEATDRVTAAAPDYPETYYFFGKTWSWRNEDAPENYSFAEDRGDFDEALQGGRRIFVRE